MKALKCDICNTYFEIDKTSGPGYSHMNSIYICQYDTTGYLYADKDRMDCCPACMVAIGELIERRRNTHHDKV